MWGTHRWPVNSPHKGPVTRKLSPFDDVIINIPHIIPQLLNRSDTGNIIGCPYYISYNCNHATINWLCFDYVKNNWKYGCGHGNKLDMSAARRRLKSSQALFSTSTHPTMVTFPFTSIRPTLPEILLFQNCQCHGLDQRSMLHSSSSIQPMHLLFVSSQLDQPFLPEMWPIKFDLELNQKESEILKKVIKPTKKTFQTSFRQNLIRQLACLGSYSYQVV